MVLRCKTCGAENLAANCYCGQCGKKLQRTATHTPEGLRPEPDDGNQARHVEASAELPRELSGFDQTPLIADEGTDHRLPSPFAMVEQDRLKREAELRDCLQRGDKTQFEARAKEEAERKRREEIVHWKEVELESLGIFMRWNSKDAANDPARDTANDNAIVDAASEARATPPPDHRDLLAGGKKVEGPKTVRKNRASFLGLTDDTVPQGNDEEREVEPHSQRNLAHAVLALAILAAAVILVALQWRSIRDYALPYVPNDSLQTKPHAMQASPPPAMAADNASRVPETEPSVAAGRSAERPSPDIPSASSGSAPAPAPAPGTDEMNQAAHASDAGVRAQLLWKAVGKGNPQAPVELAKMYEEGSGVVQSCDQARILLRAAAAKGNAQAKLNLGQIQLRGDCSAR